MITSWILAILIAAWVTLSKRNQLHSINEQIESAVSRNNILKDKGVTFEALQEKLSEIELRISERSEVIANAEANFKISNDTKYASELEEWLFSVDKLSHYSEAHPEFKIPEMSMLSPADWLTVTNEADLESEADYRLAMAKLREIAKVHTVSNIKNALKAYQGANAGELPDNALDLLPFSNNQLDPETLERYEAKPSIIPEHFTRNGIQVALKEKNSNDDIWFSKFFFLVEGGHMVTDGGITEERQIEPLMWAISEYENEYGRSPEGFSDIASKLTNQNDFYPEIFNAMKRKPVLDEN